MVLGQGHVYIGKKNGIPNTADSTKYIVLSIFTALKDLQDN